MEWKIHEWVIKIEPKILVKNNNRFPFAEKVLFWEFLLGGLIQVESDKLGLLRKQKEKPSALEKEQ